MADLSVSFYSQKMSRHVCVHVVFPFDTVESFREGPPCPTLYFLPGYSGNARTTLTLNTVAAEAALRGIAVVIPDGENSFYMDQPDIHALYEQFVAQELLQITRKLLPLSAKREETFLGGISMGGFGCLMIGSRHPEVFGKLLAMSPVTHAYRLFDKGFSRAQIDRCFQGEDQYLAHYHPLNVLKRAKADGRLLPEIYLCCGEQDLSTYEMDCDFVRGARAAGIPVRFRAGDGAHEAAYWNRWMAEGLDFLKNGGWGGEGGL